MRPESPFQLLQISDSESVRVTMRPDVCGGMVSYILQISQEIRKYPQ
jgi:hypothetical protein